MKSSRVPSSQRFAGLQHCVVVYQLPDWHLVQPFLLLHLLDCKQQTALAAISCRVWTAFSKYWVAPPHTVIRYTILLIMAPYAIINFGWKVEFLPILFKPLTLYVSFLISEHWWGESCQGPRVYYQLPACCCSSTSPTACASQWGLLIAP